MCSMNMEFNKSRFVYNRTMCSMSMEFNKSRFVYNRTMCSMSMQTACMEFNKSRFVYNRTMCSVSMEFNKSRFVYNRTMCSMSMQTACMEFNKSRFVYCTDVTELFIICFPYLSKQTWLKRMLFNKTRHIFDKIIFMEYRTRQSYRNTQHILFTVIWHQIYGKGPFR